jgi:hypothetical protein
VKALKDPRLRHHSRFEIFKVVQEIMECPAVGQLSIAATGALLAGKDFLACERHCCRLSVLLCL